MTKTILSLLLFLQSLSGACQEGFLTRLFFPVTFGLSFPLNDSERNGRFITSEGAEYRFRSRLPLFARVTFDNLSLKYAINPNPVTNATTGELETSVLSVGYGIRTNPGKFRFSWMLQAGILNYRFPRVISSSSGYNVEYGHQSRFSTGLVSGIEYYFVNDFAAVAELHYVLVPSKDVFLNRNFHYGGFRLGITALLF